MRRPLVLVSCSGCERLHEPAKPLALHPVCPACAAARRGSAHAVVVVTRRFPAFANGARGAARHDAAR